MDRLLCGLLDMIRHIYQKCMRPSCDVKLRDSREMTVDARRMILYCIFYLVAFIYVEQIHSGFPDHLVHSVVDDKIPFLEIFVLPYMIWFPYIVLSVIDTMFTDQHLYRQYGLFLATGMTLFIIVSALYYNGHQLRPEVFPRNNIFTALVSFIYSLDPARNVLPSIHVYDSVGAWIATMHSDYCRKHRWIQAASFIVSTLIILSTMFIKQHSFVDVVSGILMAVIFYPVFFLDECPVYYGNLLEKLREYRHRLSTK